MAATVKDPIYKTEVVQVSELPTVKNAKSDAIFLLALDGKSKQMSFAALSTLIGSNVRHSVSADICPTIDQLLSNTSSLCCSLNELSCKEALSVSSLKNEIKTTADIIAARLSKKIDSVSADIVHQETIKLNLRDAQIRSLKSFVEALNLELLRSNIQTIQTDEKKLKADVADVKQYSVTMTEKLSNLLTATAESTYKKSTTDSKTYADSVAINTTCIAADYTDAAVNTISSNLALSISVLAQDLSVAESLSGVANDISYLSSGIADLDIRLYGLKITDFTTKGKSYTTVLSVGDVERLSAEISSVEVSSQSRFMSLDDKITELSTFALNQYSIAVIPGGPFTIMPSATTRVKLNIHRDNCIPISISAAKVVDSAAIEIEDIKIGMRYIETLDTAVIELTNTSSDTAIAYVRAYVAYLKEK